jgi:hypothetical protein
MWAGVGLGLSPSPWYFVLHHVTIHHTVGTCRECISNASPGRTPYIPHDHYLYGGARICVLNKALGFVRVTMRPRYRAFAWEPYHIMVPLPSTLHHFNEVRLHSRLVDIIRFKFYVGVASSPRLGWLVTTGFGSKTDICNYMWTMHPKIVGWLPYDHPI